MSGISILAYIVLTLSVVYAFVYPAMGDVSALTDQKQKYNDSLETVKNIENKKNELLTQFNNIPDEQKQEVNSVLPTSYDFVRLVSQIDAVAARNGISITRVDSKETSQSTGASIEEAGPEKPYHSAILSLSFKASYEKFNLFMNDLGKSLRILDVRSVKIGSDLKGVYNFDVEFETYWLK